MKVDARGWLCGIRHEPSPNFDARPSDEVPSLLVIHAISLPPREFGSGDIVDFFLDRLDIRRHPFFEEIRDVHVSAHFLIRRDGELIQFVSCDDRAWHAGVSCWRERERCNDFSIGVELEGCDDLPFEAEQYEALRQLAAALASRYPLAAMAGHNDIAPGRKTDPGPCFDWAQLASIPLPRNF